MKRVLRYQSQLLYGRRYRVLRQVTLPRVRALALRPKRAGPAKPRPRCTFGIAW